MDAWVRLHYVYPYPHVDEVISLMAEGKVLPYLDIPFQHAAPNVLRAMKRPGNVEKTLDRIHDWRTTCPDLAIRSTFIVGFPGETDEDFQILLDWLEEAKLDRVGAFKYEPVAGASANELGLAPVPPEIQQSRWRRFMEKQQKISYARQKAKVGQRLPVILDRVFAGGGEGRTKADAPEIDGKVFVASRRPLRAGAIVTVKIDRAEAYDLHATAV
jgi:ribosomal protein S12 methylthiotransferase